MRLKLIIALVAVVAISCGTGQPKKTGRLVAGVKAPAFALGDIFGTTEINSSKVFYSNQATVVVIWSMACPTCREALLEIERLYQEYSSRAVAFVGINFDIENIQGVKAFIKGEGISFPMLWDKRARVARSYRAADYTFSIFVVNSDGRIAFAQYDHPPDLEQRIKRELDKLVKRPR